MNWNIGEYNEWAFGNNHRNAYIGENYIDTGILYEEAEMHEFLFKDGHLFIDGVRAEDYKSMVKDGRINPREFTFTEVVIELENSVNTRRFECTDPMCEGDYIEGDQYGFDFVIKDKAILDCDRFIEVRFDN